MNGIEIKGFPALNINDPQFWVKNDEEVEEWEKAQDAAIIEHNFMHCGASQNYLKGVGFDRFVVLNDTWEHQTSMTLLKNIGLQFLERVKKGEYVNLVLTGKPGIGKTFLSLCILKEVCRMQIQYPHLPPEWNLKGYEAGIYRTSDRLCEELKQASSYSSRVGKYDLIDTYAKARLFILDEIGRTNQKNERDAIFAILDRRYQDGKPNILITNYTKDKLSECLGDALVNRIAESQMSLVEDTINKCPSMRDARIKGQIGR